MMGRVQFPDDEGDNVPNEVDELLAREMLRLSTRERTAFQEEVHGVNCTLREETPEMVESALNQLAHELDQIPPSEKQAYLRSQTMAGSYVQTKSFRLRFLRGSNYDIPWVAQRIVTFLELVSELVGEVALQRPIRLADFSPRELNCLRMGRYQFLPFPDRIGRRILVAFLDETWESFPMETKAKIATYMSWTAGNDIVSQKKGVAAIVWFDEQFRIPQRPKKTQYLDHKIQTTRVTAIHMCTPDTPFYRFRGAVAKMRMARSRRWLQTHLGNSMENRYALQSYGIPIGQLPITYTGKIKLRCIKQWVAARMAIETAEFPHVADKIIEFPQPADVVIRQGWSSVSHSGNLSFRNALMAMIKEHEISKEGINFQRRAMVRNIRQKVHDSGGRFLIWNEDGWWNELDDEEKKLTAKIEYQIKELRKSIRSETRRRVTTTAILQADTSIFRSDHEPKPQQSLPFDLHHEIDETQLREAACCVAKCFQMDIISACR